MVLSAGGEGTEVIYALRNNDTLASKIINELSNSGQIVRKYYQRRLPTDSSKDYYYVIRETPNTEALIVEYGFLDNETDASRLKSNYKTYAEAVVKAVANYGGYNYVPLDTKYYIVKKGDTLYSIANNYGLTVDELKSLNNLASNILSIGQSLLIKKEEIAPEDNLPGYEYYTVIAGDTLWSIARKYNLTVDELKTLNNLVSNTLSIGQKLIVGKTSSSNLYIVKKGDTLYSIANNFNVTVDAIKAANNLSSNILSIGEELIIPSIPSSETIATNTYTVVSGDTLYNIAKKFNTTVTELKSLNNLNTNILTIGQKLLIPS
jgi:LysM repeat protein